jgi:DNA-binding MarR family transcriptional regulator
MPNSPLNNLGIGFLLGESARLLRRSMNRRVQHLGLTQEQWRTLFHLSQAEGCTQVALADKLEVQPISLVRILDKLQDNDWVERRPSPTDRRAFQLYLTPAAAPLLEELTRIGRTTRDEALAGISTADIQRLALILETIKDNLSLAEAQQTPATRTPENTQ